MHCSKANHPQHLAKDYCNNRNTAYKEVTGLQCLQEDKLRSPFCHTDSETFWTSVSSSHYCLVLEAGNDQTYCRKNSASGCGLSASCQVVATTFSQHQPNKNKKKVNVLKTKKSLTTELTTEHPDNIDQQNIHK